MIKGAITNWKESVEIISCLGGEAPDGCSKDMRFPTSTHFSHKNTMYLYPLSRASNLPNHTTDKMVMITSSVEIGAPPAKVREIVRATDTHITG